MSPSSPPVSFGFGENKVRIFKDAKGEPWFVGKDVASALGYEWKGIASIKHVPEEWRGVQSVQTPSAEQEMLTLSEQGLYFFLGRSDKPKALPFQKWLAGEVLPAIRKTGKYEKQPHPLPNGCRERQNRLKREEEHCTHNEGRPIEAAVNYWCSLRGIRRADALAAIRVRFGLRIFNRPPLHLHEDILNWISEQCGEDVSSLPTARPVKTPPKPEPCPLGETICLPPKPLRQRPPITLSELEMDAADCQRRLGILCNGLALTAGTVRRDGPHALINEAIRDNLNAAHAAAQTALSLLKGIRNLCHAAQ